MEFRAAIDHALEQAMASDDRVIVLGEDVHTLRLNLFARYGSQRVRAAPISEPAFLAAAVGAAMTGLNPVVEIMLVDFIAVALDALVNQAAKIETFTGGDWTVPLVVRAACGGGYGDGGQHEQALWGWIAHIPGIAVAVPSTPADAGALMLGCLEHPGPAVFLEHKLLSDTWRDDLGRGGRKTVSYGVPSAGNRGWVPESWKPIPLGRAEVRREGPDLGLVAVGVGAHWAMEAAEALSEKGVSCEVVDLRTVQPLDRDAIVASASKTGRIVSVARELLRA